VQKYRHSDEGPETNGLMTPDPQQCRRMVPSERKAAMLRFEGDRTLGLPLDIVWSKLTDARFLVKCIPDLESVSVLEPDHLKMVLRPSLAFVRGTLDVDLRVFDAVPQKSVRIVNLGKGIGSSSTVEAILNFSAADAGTLVHWTAEVKELGGLLKLVPPGLIRGAAQKVINDAWTIVEAKIQEA
jgi:carbon monoxide dehydrogenase subunit G